MPCQSCLACSRCLLGRRCLAHTGLLTLLPQGHCSRTRRECMAGWSLQETSCLVDTGGTQHSLSPQSRTQASRRTARLTPRQEAPPVPGDTALRLARSQQGLLRPPVKSNQRDKACTRPGCRLVHMCPQGKCGRGLRLCCCRGRGSTCTLHWKSRLRSEGCQCRQDRRPQGNTLPRPLLPQGM